MRRVYYCVLPFDVVCSCCLLVVISCLCLSLCTLCVVC